MLADDIAAISTPPGEGGIAIIRLSGPGVIEKSRRFFKPRRAEYDINDRSAYSLTLGWITDREGEAIDEVLLGLMKAPHSYTGEDVVEINCHGGFVPARRCLERVLAEDIRPAQPGEFTRRAFLNGRLDLSQAEAVIDIIRAKSDKGLRLALQQLEGKNARYIAALEDGATWINAVLEASLDFPDEVGEPDYDEIERRIDEMLKQLEQMLEAARRSQVYYEGVAVAICGKPNVGKSSWLNILLQKEKAIVTEIPGTTRDVIEDYVNIRGIPVRLMDTAGIRASDEPVEKIGVERSFQVMARADLVILMLDVQAGITEEDMRIREMVGCDRLIVMVNKEDLEDKNIEEKTLRELFPGVKVIHGSAREMSGLEQLEAAIEETVLSGQLGLMTWN